MTIDFDKGYLFQTRTLAIRDDADDGWNICPNYVDDFCSNATTLSMALLEYKSHLRDKGILLEDGIRPGERLDGKHYLFDNMKIVGFRFLASMDAEVYDKRGEAIGLEKKHIRINVRILKIAIPDLRAEY